MAKGKRCPRPPARTPQIGHYLGQSDYTLECQEGTHRLAYLGNRKWIWIRPGGSITTLWECVKERLGADRCPCPRCRNRNIQFEGSSNHPGDYWLEGSDGVHTIDYWGFRSWCWFRPNDTVLIFYECVAELVGQFRCDCPECRGARA